MKNVFGFCTVCFGRVVEVRKGHRRLGSRIWDNLGVEG